MLAPAWKERVMTVDDGLVAALPAVARLALVYAPALARQQTLALLALDARLATLIRRSSEPMLAQLRLAWWREAIAQDPARWPQGEPVLATLRSWGPRAGEVTVLVDGWEALTAPAPLSSAQIAAFAQGRADAAAALALTLGRPQDVEAARQLGRIWGIEDVAMRLAREDERTAALSLADAQGALPRVGRPLRALRVLAGLSRRRRLAGGEEGATSPAAVFEALKLGLLGL
jgi:phytoene synthase